MRVAVQVAVGLDRRQTWMVSEHLATLLTLRLTAYSTEQPGTPVWRTRSKRLRQYIEKRSLVQSVVWRRSIPTWGEVASGFISVAEVTGPVSGNQAPTHPPHSTEQMKPRTRPTFTLTLPKIR